VITNGEQKFINRHWKMLGAESTIGPVGSALTPSGRLEEAFEEHRRYVLKVLSRRCGWMAPEECEEVLQDAYLVLLERERDGRLEVGEMAPAQVRAFLTQTAINKALDEGKRAGRSRSVPLEDAELTVADEGRAPEDVAAAGLEGARLREIVGELSERKRAIVKLRFFFERSPDEIQGFLGITERVYRRELERAMRQIQEDYALVRDGSYCDSRRSGIIALMSGISGPGRAKAAREHLATCPSCSAWAAEMRDAARKVGAFVPMPDLLFHRGPLTRLVETISGLRDSAAEAGASAKQHASALVTRVDPTPAGVLGGARPGAAAALIAGCITLGSGATYCAVNGVPEQLAGAADSVFGHTTEKKKEEPKREAPSPEPTPPPVAEAPVEPPVAEPVPSPSSNSGEGKKQQSQRDEGTRASRSQKAGNKSAPEFAPVEEGPAPVPEESEPVPEEEFGFEGTPAPAPEPAPASAPAASSQSSGGGGEFGP
jgi:RNA polymerase sigma factor (sigma-70 family)